MSYFSRPLERSSFIFIEIFDQRSYKDLIFNPIQVFSILETFHMIKVNVNSSTCVFAFSWPI